MNKQRTLQKWVSNGQKIEKRLLANIHFYKMF